MNKIFLSLIFGFSVSFSQINEENRLQNTLNKLSQELDSYEIKYSHLKLKKLENLNRKQLQLEQDFTESLNFIKNHQKDDKLININSSVSLIDEVRQIKEEHKLNILGLMTEISKVKNDTNDDIRFLTLREHIQKTKLKLATIKNDFLLIKDEHDLTLNQLVNQFKEEQKKLKINYRNNLKKINELYKLQLNTIINGQIDE